MEATSFPFTRSWLPSLDIMLLLRERESSQLHETWGSPFCGAPRPVCPDTGQGPSMGHLRTNSKEVNTDRARSKLVKTGIKFILNAAVVQFNLNYNTY